MSLALTSAQSLRAVNTWIGIIDSNIEGTNRVAYKNVRPVLTDGLGRSKLLNGLKGVIPSTTLSIQATTTEFTQGQVINTDDPNHRAINGEGYFIFADQQGKALYSRDGEVKSIPGEYFNYLSNSRGLYMLDRAMAINFGAHEEHLTTAAEINQGLSSGRSWLNANEKIPPPLTAADFEFTQPKPIWFMQEVGTGFDEWGSSLSYRYQTVMLRKSFVVNSENYKNNNDLTIEIPGQAVGGPAVPEFLIDDPPVGGALRPLDLNDPNERILHPMATQVYLNGQLVKVFAPNTTTTAQSLTLTNAELAPFMQSGMNTLAIRATEWTGEDGILIEGNLGGERIISDKTWAAQLVDAADAGGIIKVNGNPLGILPGNPLFANFAYAAGDDRVALYADSIVPVDIDDDVFSDNYGVVPPNPPVPVPASGPPPPDGDRASNLLPVGSDPDGVFRLNLVGNRRITDFTIHDNILLDGDPSAILGATATYNTTVNDYDQIRTGAPVAIYDDQGNLVNDEFAATGTGIDYTINGTATLDFYIPDLDDTLLGISYLDPLGTKGDFKVRIRFEEVINGVTVEYYEVFTFERNGALNLPLTFDPTATPDPLPTNFQGTRDFAILQAMTIPDYDDMVLAIAPNQQGLRYSQYGSTIFEVQDKVGVQTTGILQTGRPGQDGFGMVMKGYLEQANAGMTEHIPMLSMAQKIFSAISKIIAVSNSVTDDMNGLIR